MCVCAHTHTHTHTHYLYVQLIVAMITIDRSSRLEYSTSYTLTTEASSSFRLSRTAELRDASNSTVTMHRCMTVLIAHHLAHTKLQN